jgi:hypothetical protein
MFDGQRGGKGKKKFIKEEEEEETEDTLVLRRADKEQMQHAQENTKMLGCCYY